MSVLIVKVPRLFFDDHRDRDCSPTARVTASNKRMYTVELDPESYADLKSDADYYAATNMGPEFRSLRNSARTTARRIDSATPTKQSLVVTTTRTGE